ncbi:MAG: hypothetical protein U0807_06330 [Candidatus Binatia bacterium]
MLNLMMIGATPAPLGATIGVIDGRLVIAILWALVSLGTGIVVRMAVDARRRVRQAPPVVPIRGQDRPKPPTARRAA